ncbi:hypothetical protein DYB25_003718 [Aphanomyces astaci]|uniref:Uncharacterized protein n=1 Tax=Aphanomyces astaci TaxID=112090 RepID=A0A397D7W2_APHAT|nr:hypothetical protein DYB25_003718 [Aphanomyces astaci]RHY39273.1 hypothetical protein DYB34_005040 [Aphanomyces astaci]RHY57727.1 hypothetical protein DYB30_004902 [Aphanomyces astaci]RHZ39602.1 hypothetical protein DYB26_003174 [Aphanomyces astaci]
MYTEALHVLSVPLERLIVEAAFMEFQRRLKLTSPSSPVNIVVPNMKTELTPEKQREFCAHLLEGGTHEDSFIMDDSTARWLH